MSVLADPARFERAIALFDAANAEDPNLDEGRPKELLYAERMSGMLARFVPDAPEVVRLAVRAQHIRRWTSPRSSFPMTREGYHRWRTALYAFHAETAGALMQQAGYDTQTIDQVRSAVAKRNLRGDVAAQMLEDVASLVFLEHYLMPFSGTKPDYEEAKWLDILRKTWRKMSPAAHEFALSGHIKLPMDLMPLIQRAVAEVGDATAG